MSNIVLIYSSLIIKVRGSNHLIQSSKINVHPSLEFPSSVSQLSFLTVEMNRMVVLGDPGWQGTLPQSPQHNLMTATSD